MCDLYYSINFRCICLETIFREHMTIKVRVVRDNRCMYMAQVCFYGRYSEYMGVCGNVCCVAAVVENCVFFNLGVVMYVVCLCMGCDGCCLFCLYCEVWSCSVGARVLEV